MAAEDHRDRRARGDDETRSHRPDPLGRRPVDDDFGTDDVDATTSHEPRDSLASAEVNAAIRAANERRARHGDDEAPLDAAVTPPTMLQQAYETAARPETLLGAIYRTYEH
ncbi:MAG: hypothetical protein AAFR23_06725, partial [Pseudomonadota bacterium]